VDSLKQTLRELVTRLSKSLEGTAFKKWFDGLGSERRSRIVKAFSLVITLTLIWWLSGVWDESDKQDKLEKLPEVQTEEVELGLDESVMTESWLEKASKQVTKNTETIKDVQHDISDIKTMFGEIKEMLAKRPAPAVYEVEGKKKRLGVNGTSEDALLGEKSEKVKSEVKVAYKEARLPQPRPISVPASRTKGAQGKQGKDGGVRTGNKQMAVPPIDLIHVNIDDLPAFEGGQGKGKQLKDQMLVPFGAFAKVTVLTGVNAPTGMKAMGQPQPILLKIQDRAVLPNRVKMNLKGCFVLGEAYGSLASERVYVRVNKISCITNDDEVIQQNIAGYVQDMDGSIGLRGRIVSRRGLFLARSLVANFIEGVARAFRTSLTNVSVTPLGGSIQSYSTGDAFKIGIGEGIAKSVEDLAKMYRELAQEPFPVIEVGAGRMGHLVLTDNLLLEAKVKLP